jgi:predicted transposase YdaD
MLAKAGYMEPRRRTELRARMRAEERGKAEGKAEGEARGRARGRAEGKAEGEVRGEVKAYFKLGWPADKIDETAKLPVTKVNNILKEIERGKQ